MKNKFLTLLIIAITLTLSGSCTRSSTPPGASHELKPNQKIFDFDYKKVTQLSIVKADPGTGDQWAAELRKNGPETADWEIVSAPMKILDRHAHGTWIEHLLDTLHTLAFAEPAPAGPLASLGLENPRFGLRWSPPGMEVRIGNAVDNESQGAGAYVLVPGTQKPFLARGAALPMLDLLETFNSLRLPTLATFDADDIAEIEVRIPGKHPRKKYAQRDGDRWTDAQHRKLAANIQEKLEAISHARILAYLDDEIRVRELRAAIKKTPLAEVEVRDIQARPTVIRLTKQGSRIYGEISSREDSAFELYPQLAQVVLSFF